MLIALTVGTRFMHRSPGNLPSSAFGAGPAADRKQPHSKSVAPNGEAEGGAAGGSKGKPNNRNSPRLHTESKQTTFDNPQEETVDEARRQCKRKLVETGSGRTSKRACAPTVGVDLRPRSGGARRGAMHDSAGQRNSKPKQPRGAASRLCSAEKLDHQWRGSSPKRESALALLKRRRKPAVDWVTEERVEKLFSFLKKGFQANRNPGGPSKTYAGATIRWCPHFLRFLMFHSKPVDHHFKGSTSKQLIRAYAKWSKTQEATLQKYMWRGESFAEEVAPLACDFLQTQVTQIILKGVLEFGEPNMVNSQQAVRENLKSGKYFCVGLL